MRRGAKGRRYKAKRVVQSWHPAAQQLKRQTSSRRDILEMLRLAVVCIVSGLGLVQGVAPACDANNCYRAVANSKSLARASSDCTSFFLATVTPIPVTKTVTRSRTTSTSTTRSVTVSTIASLTVTTRPTSSTTVTVTDITTVPGTVSETDISTSTTVTTTTTTTTIPSVETFRAVRYKGRQATVLPSRIPAYASPCSGAIQYSSACSCIGVMSHRTTTVSAPTSTITVTVSATAVSTLSSLTTTTSSVVATETAVTIETNTSHVTSTDTTFTTTTVSGYTVTTSTSTTVFTFEPVLRPRRRDGEEDWQLCGTPM
ncbi:hypothetical protein BR93DRAFT_324929 [Coniochaeta sp. PMI_546]|nr:hypothetical protein BR93DRAFT_324929 [Coniochaeta sp. PMI_546]